MPDSVEHRVAIFKLAQERRRAGKPVWKHHLRLQDVFHNEDFSFLERRDAIVERIRATAWYKGEGEHSEFHALIEELSEVEDEDDFDAVWSSVYDEADYARVWIQTV